MKDALNFVDNQVLRKYGFVHQDLLYNFVSPIPFDYPAWRPHTQVIIHLWFNLVYSFFNYRYMHKISLSLATKYCAFIFFGKLISFEWWYLFILICWFFQNTSKWPFIYLQPKRVFHMSFYFSSIRQLIHYG